MADAASDLYIRREREVYRECLRRSAVVFRGSRPRVSTRRSGRRAPATRPARTRRLTSIRRPQRRLLSPRRIGPRGVRAAARRRRGPAATGRRAALASVPTIDGREVVMREAVVVPGLESPMHYAAGVDLARLARLVSGGADVPTIIAVYHDNVDRCRFAGLLTGLSFSDRAAGARHRAHSA